MTDHFEGTDDFVSRKRPSATASGAAEEAARPHALPPAEMQSKKFHKNRKLEEYRMMSTGAYTVVILAILVLVPAADQLTKALAMFLTGGGEKTVWLIPKVLRFQIVRNKGAAMGLWADSAAGRVVFMLLSVVAILLVALILLRGRRHFGLSDFTAVTLALICGGGIGNMIDRIFFGEALFQGSVIDFIDFCALPSLWRWTFNLADACICLGVGLFVLSILRELLSDARRKKREAKDASASAAAPSSMNAPSSTEAPPPPSDSSHD